MKDFKNSTKSHCLNKFKVGSPNFFLTNIYNIQPFLFPYTLVYFSYSVTMDLFKITYVVAMERKD